MNCNETYLAPSKFYFVITLKFIFTIIGLIFLLWIYFTYDEYVFSGLPLIDDRNSDNYTIGRAVLLIGLVFFSVCLLIDLLIQVLGFTFNMKKNNIISLTLHIFQIYLLFYFVLGAWHYVTIWYIFIVTQLPSTLLELYGFIYIIVYDRMKYCKIRDFSIVTLKSK